MSNAPRFCAVVLSVCAMFVPGTHIALADPQIKLNYVYASTGFSPSQPFSHPTGAFYDAVRGELYVADTGNGQIVILDKRGLAVAKIRHFVVDPKSGERHTGEPRSVALRKNRDILVADNLCSYLDVLDSSGSFLEKVWLGDLVGKPRSSVQPRCIAMDANGNVYVGVSGNSKEILVLGPDLRLKAQMGVESRGDSRGITGLWVDKDGKVFATYAVGVCVRVYAPDGKQLFSFGVHDSGPNNFSLPAGLVTDSIGRLWVLDTLRHIVAVHKPVPATTGVSYVFSSLAIGGMGSDAGELTYPSGIAGDGATKLFIVESTGARVQAFQIAPEEVKADQG